MRYMGNLRIRKIILVGFVFISFILLIMPNTALFNEKDNVNMIKLENRKINPVPEFHPRTKKFYIELEKCYQDRLSYRNKLIRFWKLANYKLGVILSNNLFMGKNEWLFSRGSFVGEFVDKKSKLAKLKEIQGYCKKNKAEFVFIAAPYKNAIYADYIPKKFLIKYPHYRTIENEMIKECKTNGIAYLSLYDSLVKAKDTYEKPIYWSDDHHWGYEGASVAANEVLRLMRSKFKGFEYNGLLLDGTYHKATKEHSQINSLGLAKSGVTNRTLAPWSKKYTDEIYGINFTNGKEEVRFLNSKDPVSNSYLWGRIVNGEGIIVNKKTKNNKVILFLHDSYGSYMTTYLSQFNRKIVNTHYRDKAGKKANTNLKYLINKYKPDIVILEMSAPSFYSSRGIDMFKNIVM